MMNELHANTGHLIVTGSYEDLTTVTVVVGTIEQAQRVADEINMAAVQRAIERGESSVSDLVRVEGRVAVRTFAIEKG